jgi:hypothetical protein
MKVHLQSIMYAYNSQDKKMAVCQILTFVKKVLVE